MSFQLFCEECGTEHDNDSYRLFCDKCHGLIEIRYESVPSEMFLGKSPKRRGMKRFIARLPIKNQENLVSMGEGDTPIIPLPRMGEKLGLRNVHAKLEYFNPTGSFKDRGNMVQVSVLQDLGVRVVTDATGGNAGHSFSAYCARAGIKFHGFADESTRGHRKLHAIGLHGTELHWVTGGKKGRAEGARKFANDNKILHMDYGKNIYFIEGLKTLAYEIAEQMDPLPDHIIVPIGNGSIYQGMYKGFSEMVEAKVIDTIPRLHGAQTEETQPFVAAFENNKWSPKSDHTLSLANGIGVNHPPRLKSLVEIARDTGGRVIAVSETKILSWQKELASLEGLIVEPTSAVVMGAAEKLIDQGFIKAADVVLFPLTGFGIKEAIPGANI